MKYCIDEFVFFRSLVFVRGWVERKPSRSWQRKILRRQRAPIEFSFRCAGEHVLPSVKWVDRPDLAAVFGPTSTDWGFELHSIFLDGEENEIYRTLELIIRSADDEVVIDRAAEHVSLAEAAEIWNQFHGRPKTRVIEIGARARSGITRREMFGACDYIGFDVMPGENVDIVGDAHFLSEYVTERVDAVASLSTFEHLIMPWQVVTEVNRVLKPGGLVITQTHQTWPVHDRPWDFFRFSKDSWRGLFNEATGFRILNAVECGPCVSTPLLQQRSNAATRLDHQPGYMISICLAEKIGEPCVSWTIDRDLYKRISGPAAYPE
jgi:SAM-dependent methyltransferase